MAKYVCSLTGDFNTWLQKIERGILDSSISANLEEAWDASGAGSRCSVRVFERYSYFGGNRVSMNVTLYQTEDRIRLCAVTSGGSQAVFFKLNTVGEESFLDILRQLVEDR